MGNLEKIVFASLAAIGSVIVYAMDWQRDQDAHAAKLDSLLARQTAILEMQIKTQEVQRPVAYGYAPAEPVRVEPTAVTIPMLELDEN